MLRFKSGFENPIIVVHYTDGSASWLSGADGTGYDWDNLAHVINYVVPNSYPNHIYTELSTARSKSGSRSLYGKVIDSYSGAGQTARQELAVYMHDGVGGYPIGGRGALIMPYMSKYFLSYWMFIPSAYDISIGGWDNIFEDTEWASPASSLAIFLNRDSLGLYWRVHGIRRTDPWTYWWSGNNREVAVPKNQWFKVGVYVERHPTNGVFRMWIDGVQIFNFQSVQTKVLLDEHYVDVFKMYGEFGIYPVERWRDDLEIWDSLPIVGPAHNLTINSTPQGIPFDIRRV